MPHATNTLQQLEKTLLPIALLDLGEKFYDFRKIDKNDLYKRCLISNEQISRREGTINGWQFRELFRCCKDIAMPGTPLSVQLADFIPITIPGGMFGLASFTAKTVRQALEVMIDFSDTVMPAYRFAMHDVQQHCHIVMEPLVDFDDIQHQLDESVCGYLLNLRHFANLTEPAVRIHLTHDPMGELEDYENKFNAKFLFSQKTIEVVFDKHHLSQALYTHNQATFEQVYTNLKTSTSLSSHATYSAKVSKVLRQRLTRMQPMNISQTAEELNISERTLARRLHQEGVSFAELKQQVSIEYSKYLLNATELPVCKVALASGYSSDSNFARAFKHATGLTPKQFRSSK